MSYLETVRSTISSTSSIPRTSEKPRNKFEIRYDDLFQEINTFTERRKPRDSITTLPSKESERLYTLSPSSRPDPFNSQLRKVRFSFITGNKFDTKSNSFYSKRAFSPSQSYHHLSGEKLTQRNEKFNKELRDFKSYVRKPLNTFVSGGLRERFNKNPFLKEPPSKAFTKTDNYFVQKMKRTLPEYTSLRTRGQSFIDYNTKVGMVGRINQLKRSMKV